MGGIEPNTYLCKVKGWLTRIYRKLVNLAYGWFSGSGIFPKILKCCKLGLWIKTFDSWWHHFEEKKAIKSWFPNGIRIFCFLTKRKYNNIDWMTRYTSLGIRNNEHPVLHSEDKTSPETGIRKRGVSGFSGLASFLLSV